MSLIDVGVLSKALEILKKYPLCDRCLGRLFALLGRGLDNAERGKALKISLLMEIHKRIRDSVLNPEEVKDVLVNMGPIAKEFMKYLGLSVDEFPPCYICKSRLDSLISEFSRRLAEVLKDLGVSTFVIGVKPPTDISEAEKEVATLCEIPYWESVRSELKRVLGKRVQELTGLKVKFEDPEVTLVVDMNSGEISTIIPSLLIVGRYWKLGRRISQSKWIKADGSKKYPLSIEEVLEALLDIVKADRAILHAAGREDVDVRMLGSGRPAIFEFHKAVRKDIDLKELEERVNECPWIKFSFTSTARRENIRDYKAQSARRFKIYKALIHVKGGIHDEELRVLEEQLKNCIIHQWTPRRVLHRKRNKLRTRRVHEVRVRKISDEVIEALIKCDGGLYIKELVSGDEGRTNPSFSSILGKECRCIELDVVYVQGS